MNLVWYHILDDMSIMSGRSDCDTQLCTQVCEYGYILDSEGCSTCDCDNPCNGYKCPSNAQCHVIQDENCHGPSNYCSSYAECK